MNMLSELAYQGVGQTHQESELGSNAALTELDKGSYLVFFDWPELFLVMHVPNALSSK